MKHLRYQQSGKEFDNYQSEKHIVSTAQGAMKTMCFKSLKKQYSVITFDIHR